MERRSQYSIQTASVIMNSLTSGAACSLIRNAASFDAYGRSTEVREEDGCLATVCNHGLCRNATKNRGITGVINNGLVSTISSSQTLTRLWYGLIGFKKYRPVKDGLGYARLKLDSVRLALADLGYAKTAFVTIASTDSRLIRKYTAGLERSYIDGGYHRKSGVLQP